MFLTDAELSSSSQTPFENSCISTGVFKEGSRIANDPFRVLVFSQPLRLSPCFRIGQVESFHFDEQPFRAHFPNYPSRQTPSDRIDRRAASYLAGLPVLSRCRFSDLMQQTGERPTPPAKCITDATSIDPKLLIFQDLFPRQSGDSPWTLFCPAVIPSASGFR